MPVFPSEEWMEAFCAEFRAQPGAQRVAESLGGTYRFVIQPAGSLEQQHMYDMKIAQGANGVPDVSWSASDSAAPTLELIADYERWRQMISGTLDIPLAMMLGRIRVRGDVGRFTSRAADARPLLDAIRSVDTTWR